MTILEMLGQSGILTVLGMGVVFGFLIIMVICVSAMGKIVQSLGAGKAGEAQAGAALVSQAGEADRNKAGAQAITAAITAAVTEYRKNNIN